jgi:hypothetical protein
MSEAAKAAATTPAQDTTPSGTKAQAPSSEAKTETPAAATPAAKAADPATDPAAKPAEAAKPSEQTKSETEQVSKPAEQKPVVPETYDLKLPEGSPLKPADLEAVAAKAKELGLSQTQAQGLLEREGAAIAAFEKQQVKDYETKVTSWATELQHDPVFGGAAFKENAELASRALKTYGDPDLIQILNETGLGNHPALNRTFLKIAKATAPDKLVIAAAETADTRSPEERFYPNMHKKKD